MTEPAPAIVRTVFLVDGFNLYHSLARAARDLPGTSVKWLDLPAMLGSSLHLVDSRARLAAIHYFSAYAHHHQAENPGKLERHRAYVRALTANGVHAHLARFQVRDVWCPRCRAFHATHEEKETDFAIACQLLTLAASDALDAGVIVSGDSDLAPAARAFRRAHPGKRLLFAFPYHRKNNELAKLAPGSFTFSRESYARHPFPDRVRLPSGNHVTKPALW